LAALEGQVKIERAWNPQTQRVGDDSIMEPAMIPKIMPKTKRLANETRLWLQITTVSDLAAVNGREIPME